MAAARNVAIILALAAVVAFVPGGGKSASLVGAILFTLLNVVFVFFGVRFYRERRMDIYSLGDRSRGLLYGGLAGIVLALAAADRWLHSGIGALVWIAVIGGSIAALVMVFREYREYRI